MGCGQSKFLDDFANLVTSQPPMAADPASETLQALDLYRHICDDEWPALLFMPQSMYTEDYESSETWEALENGPHVIKVLQSYPHSVKTFKAPASDAQAYLVEYDPRKPIKTPPKVSFGDNVNIAQGGVQSTAAEYESDDEGERKLVARQQTPYPFSQQEKTPYAVSHPASASAPALTPYPASASASAPALTPYPETVSPMSVSVFRSATPAVPLMGGGKTMRQRLYMVASGLS